MFKEKIAEILAKELRMKKEEILKLIETPQQQFGDYSFPCFFLASKLKKNPLEIAKDITQNLNKKLPSEIEKIETVSAYINFFINKEKLFENIVNSAVKEGEKYGSSNLGKGKKVLIEHTSINPNASPHVGRARNALIGDAIVRIFKFQNYNVQVHYYVNDVGKQIAMLVLAAKGKKVLFKDLLKKYIGINKKIEKNKELEKEVFELLNRLEQGDVKTRNQFKNIVDACVKGQSKILSEIGIKYDSYDYESKYLWNKETEKILDMLKKTKKLFLDSEGRYVLNQEEYGFAMKTPVLVLTRSDKTSLYPLRDLAYNMEKIKKAEKNIVILGEEQKLYFQQLKAALELLGYKAPVPVHYSFVLLSSGKSMSTRRGEVILLEDFIKEAIDKAKKEMNKRKSKGDAKAVALAAVKYSILKVDENKNVIFSWDEALNFEGDSGPYLQYAYARASNILKKAKEKSKKMKPGIHANEINDKETALIRQIAEFPEICRKAAEQFKPHLVAAFSFRLAQLFNDFYESCPVLKAEEERGKRILLVQATRQVLKNALNLLGIEALENM